MGASNGPAAGRRAILPHEDTVLHRWAEVYLSPYGWVPFDATADHGEPPKRTFVGTFRPRVLIVSKRDAGPPLGQSYVVANDHPRNLERKRAFVWTRGARAAFECATELAAAGHHAEADTAYQEIVEKYKGSRWAKAAEQRVQTK